MTNLLKPFFLSHPSSQSHLFGQLHPLHSHSQMLALPIIPPTVSSPLANMKDYFEQTGKCCICQIGSEDLVINSSTNFISLVPNAATFPFEIWIVPNYHFEHFHELDAEKVALQEAFCEAEGILRFYRFSNSSPKTF